MGSGRRALMSASVSPRPQGFSLHFENVYKLLCVSNHNPSITNGFVYFCSGLKHCVMDSNMTGTLLSTSTPQSFYFQAKKDDGIIDLGLSLKTLHAQAYHQSNRFTVPEGYDHLIQRPQSNPKPKDSNVARWRTNAGDCEDDTEGVQSVERWTYVKVNMDGVFVGRKICIRDHAGYSSLAHHLEDMFDRQCISGLRLFQTGSDFLLFYEDKERNWRSVGDVPWKEFVDSVKRLRIVRRNEALLLSS